MSTPKMAKTSKTILLAAIGLVVAFAYLYLTIEPPGYCKAQQRNISDAEFVQTIIPLVRRDIAQEQPIKKGSGSFYAEWNGYVPALDDVTCCEVNREGTHTILNRLFGTQFILVLIAPPQQENRYRFLSRTVAFYFDVCGKLVDSDVGLRSTKGHPIFTNPIQGK